MRSYTAQTPVPSPPFWPPPPPAAAKNSSLPMLYYGLIVVGTAAIVLAMYNLIFIKWSAPRNSPSSPRNIRSNDLAEAARSARSRSFENLDTFKYKKQKEGSLTQEQGQVTIDYECAVCLSVFEDGEEVRKLPSCKHSFHAPCIDMWLHSHSDCPLCRTTVPVVSWCHRDLTTSTQEEEHSREVLLVSNSTGSLPV